MVDRHRPERVLRNAAQLHRRRDPVFAVERKPLRHHRRGKPGNVNRAGRNEARQRGQVCRKQGKIARRRIARDVDCRRWRCSIAGIGADADPHRQPRPAHPLDRGRHIASLKSCPARNEISLPPGLAGAGRLPAQRDRRSARTAGRAQRNFHQLRIRPRAESIDQRRRRRSPLIVRLDRQRLQCIRHRNERLRRHRARRRHGRRIGDRRQQLPAVDPGGHDRFNQAGRRNRRDPARADRLADRLGCFALAAQRPDRRQVRIDQPGRGRVRVAMLEQGCPGFENPGQMPC